MIVDDEHNEWVNDQIESRKGYDNNLDFVKSTVGGEELNYKDMSKSEIEEIVNNFLEEKDFASIEKLRTNPDLQWYWNSVGNKNESNIFKFMKSFEGFIKSFENFESDEEFGDRETEFGSFVNPEGEEYFNDDEEEYDPYSYGGCGCCPVCTGEKDCECGCPECNYPEELEELEESKKSGVTASLKKKSKASGIPMGILRKVFSKGMQAWNAGHRPGVAQHQWGMGRVNSFITGAGGARKADADLWAKARAAKARKKKK